MGKDKPFKTFEEQIDILISRNLIINNKELALSVLQHDTYYNIVNGYKDPFLVSKSPDLFSKGTTFEHLHTFYLFDKKIRAICLNISLEIEKHLKTLIAYYFSSSYGPLTNNYLSLTNFKSDSERNKKNSKEIIITLQKNLLELFNNGNPPINHYYEYEKNFEKVPLWVLINFITFGTTSKFYASMQFIVQTQIAAKFNLTAKDLGSFMKFLSIFRNNCAHGNRIYINKPFFKKKKRRETFIPNTSFHKKLEISKNNENNFIQGKSDFLAIIITFKTFLPEKDFASFLKTFNEELTLVQKKLPKTIYDKIIVYLGLTNIDLKHL